MTAAARPRLEVFADLVLDVDGSAVTVTADGSDVRIALAAPADVLDAVTGVPLLPVGVGRRSVRRGLAHWAETVAAQGVGVTVTGPDGVLLTVGSAAAPSRLVRLATGTDRVALGRWTAVRGPVVVVVRRRVVAAVRSLVARIRH